MKRYLNIIMIVLILVLIVLVLRNNKQEINAEIAYAEQEVDALPVRVEEVKLSTLDRTLRLPGVLQANKELLLMSQTQGQVIRVFKSVGDRVKKGEVIAKVDDEILNAQAQLTAAIYDKAQKDLERAEKLKDAGALTAQQFEGLQLKAKEAGATYITTNKRLEDTAIKAPFGGIVNQIFAKEGGVLGPGVPVCELVDVHKLTMQVKVDENAILAVIPGEKVRIRTDLEPEITYLGLVASVAVKPDPGLQYPVTVEMENDAGKQLKAGMMAMAIFSFTDSIESPVIDRTAIVGSLKTASVYVIEDGHAIQKSVTIGYADAKKVKIAEGLTAGEMLVVSGQSTLRNGQKVKILK